LNNPTSDAGTDRPPAFFYGWVVIAVGFITLGIAFGIWYSYSVFFLSIVKDFGWDRAWASSIFSVFLISHALTGLLTGYLQDRFGPRIVIPVGTWVLACAMVLTSRSNTLWQFYLTYGVLAGASISLMGFTSHAAFLPSWFERKRGLAFGIATSGIGFGMLVIVPVVEKVIASYGWRNAYLFLAGMVLLIVGPLNAVFSRRNPADLNLSPDGDPEEMQGDRPRPQMIMKAIDVDWANRDWTLAKALRTRRFWFLAATFSSIAFAYQGTLLHSVSAMVDSGLTRQTAAAYFGLLGIAGSAGKIMFGYLSDRFGRERASTVGGILAIVGIFCLLNATATSTLLPMLFALLFGLGYGAAAPLLPSISADIFIGKSFGRIFAMIGIGGGAGGALGSFLCGLLRDVSGGYTLPLTLCMLSLFLACMFIWLASPRKVRQMVKNNA